MRAHWIVSLGLMLATALPLAAQPCPTCLPLDQVGGAPHRGLSLGLYEPGTNSPPPAQQALANAAALEVVPRDMSGTPAGSGLIGWLSIGMSNTNQEFAAFERLEDTRAGRNPRLVVLDAALGGQSAEVIMDPTAPYWARVSQRLAAAGLAPAQVQVVWLKEADGAVPDTSFPAHAETLSSHLQRVVQQLEDRFPNLRLCYLSSRTYGGYSNAAARSEPLSLETGYAVRWLIARQLAGDPALNADPVAGPIEAPVLLWGPYLWANGATPRASDGLTWMPTDVEGDGVHPADPGEAKVAGLLRDFFAAEPSAAAWRDAAAGESSLWVDAEADSWVDQNAPLARHGSDPEIVWANPSAQSYVRFALAGVTGSVLHAKLSLLTPPGSEISIADIVGVTSTSWDEATLDATNAPPLDGGLLGTIPGASRGTAVSLDVTGAVNAALIAGPAAKLSLAVRSLVGSSAPQRFLSRETTSPPRLVLGLGRTVSAPAPQESGVRLRARANPFAGDAEVLLATREALTHATLEAFDVHGRREAVLHDGPLASGQHRFGGWGARAAAGVHLVRLRGVPESGGVVSAQAKLVRIGR